MLTKTYGVAGIPDWFETGAKYGWVGVEFFFILSGAVISQSAIGKSWGQFAQSRFLRLFPVYFLAIGLAVILLPRTGVILSAGALLDLTGLGLLEGKVPIVGAAWTLVYEIQFYAVVTLAIIFSGGIRRDNELKLIYLLLALVLVAHVADIRLLSIATMAPYGAYFVLGALLGSCRNWSALKEAFFPILIAYVLAVGQLNRKMTENPELAGGKDAIILCASLVALPSLIVIFSSLRLIGATNLGKWSSAIALVSLMTYPIYLLHETVGLATVNILVNSGVSIWPASIFVLVGVIVASLLSVKYYEPFSRAALRRIFSWSGAGKKPNPEATN